ncbi:hypothetical protein COT40_00065 [Candidatus Peregrinibacteria bacterium CG08_land_8_20_14_0_20_41_10]|nr:MAG: hypothetical protein COT40_00065 [Candidatus Peregrinibacteria bacterium CG08_land_8_20_14_0_20_41_10]
MLEVYYKPIFVRQYKRLPLELQKEVKEKIKLFQQDRKHPFLKVHKLKGRLKNFWSFPVNYEYRIVFESENKNTVVLLVVGNHDVYK